MILMESTTAAHTGPTLPQQHCGVAVRAASGFLSTLPKRGQTKMNELISYRVRSEPVTEVYPVLQENCSSTLEAISEWR